ncbi:hypothetical protein RhiJN_06694 [Ceratobasidium sp. AG-Ba]|nr:hypothetical protein RhiJN_06694 [Ceratobasidium sp. AG-Ba]
MSTPKPDKTRAFSSPVSPSYPSYPSSPTPRYDVLVPHPRLPQRQLVVERPPVRDQHEQYPTPRRAQCTHCRECRHVKTGSQP